MVMQVRVTLAQGFLQAAIGATMLAIVLTSRCSGQNFVTATEVKGTEDLEIWAGGVAAQHGGTTTFNTEVWTAGVRLGRVLTAPHGPGWLHGSLQWSLNVIPLFIVSNLQTAYGAELDPIAFRWNFRHQGWSRPYVEMAGGVVFTNVNIPRGDTSNFNVVPKIGFGWQIFRRAERSIDMGIYAWHLSNAWTAPRNPSVNGIQITAGYHWFKPRIRTTADLPGNNDIDKGP